MSQTANPTVTIDTLKQHRLRDLWRPDTVAELRDAADTDAERDVLAAVLEYNEVEKEQWERLGFDMYPDDPPIRGMGYEALASSVQKVASGEIATDTLNRNGSTPTGSDTLAAIDEADAETRRQAFVNLRKADSFDHRRGLEARADTLRAEAADLLGVGSPEAIDVDALADRVDLDAVTPDGADDGPDVDAMARYERVDEAEARRKKAENHRAAGRTERADDLEAEIDTLVGGLDREELTDALAEYVPRDYDAIAAEYADPGELAARIDTLESKARAMRGRGVDDRADEIEAELDALRDRAEELTR